MMFFTVDLFDLIMFILIVGVIIAWLIVAVVQERRAKCPSCGHQREWSPYANAWSCPVCWRHERVNQKNCPGCGAGPFREHGPGCPTREIRQ